MPGLSDADLKGRVTVVNVWASWCGPCRQEHPLLVELAKDPSIRVVGINQRDDPDNARRFLGALGNPYAAVGTDPKGRASIDWGVYGVPETFIVGPDGTIRHKHIGPLTRGDDAGLQGPAEANPARLSLTIATSSALRNAERSFGENGFGPPETSPMARRSSIRLRVASAMPMEASVNGRPVGADHVGARLHTAACERNIRRHHDGAAPGALGDPVIGSVETRAHQHALHQRIARHVDEAVRHHQHLDPMPLGHPVDLGLDRAGIGIHVDFDGLGRCGHR